MDPVPWDALAAPFTATDLRWRVVALSPDQLSAQVRPQLRAEAVAARLDEVLGRSGWSHALGALGERGLVCTLGIGGVYRAAAAPYTALTELEDAAEDAFVAAAALFGLRAPLTLTELPWVDYDPEQRQPLYEPDLNEPDLNASNLNEPALNAPDPTGAAEPEQVLEAKPAPAPAEPSSAPEPVPAKSAGQRAIDKLVDRLKADGRGLQAAKLLTRYGGYGGDPSAARELYAKLRELLLEQSAE